MGKFKLGQIAATSSLLNKIAELDKDVNLGSYLLRHVKGDWGDVGKEDWVSNDEAVESGGRILSAYQVTDNLKIWIITEWDRSATTLLLPEDY